MDADYVCAENICVIRLSWLSDVSTLCNTLYCNTLYCDPLYCNTLYCNTLYCNTLYCLLRGPSHSDILSSARCIYCCVAWWCSSVAHY